MCSMYGVIVGLVAVAYVDGVRQISNNVIQQKNETVLLSLYMDITSFLYMITIEKRKKRQKVSQSK